MIRVVIDTNVLVSALLQPKGLPAAVLILALSGQVELCVSEAVLAEYGEVIRRPHLKRDPAVVERTMQAIRKLGHWVKPAAVHIDACGDPGDNIFVERAQAGSADCLVTGNKRHFPDRWKKTEVISVRELLERVIEEAPTVRRPRL
jgi:putative PIN family toxin of toxin-antitoxin system